MDGWTVNSFEALQRQKSKQPVVNRIGKDETWKFKMSLAGGDIIELKSDENKRDLYVVKVVTVTRVGGKEYARIQYSAINDASKNPKNESSLLNPLYNELQCRKVFITPLGDIHCAND